MGCFHEGHLSLMRHARRFADYVVVTLFVNPLQFGPREDFARYPRDFDRDAALAAANGVDVVFAPDPADMYPPGYQTHITVDQLSQGLCGRNRPGHFSGVTTVVAKLFHIVRPNVAVFGSKDFQQLAVIRRMLEDLNWDIKIIAHPVVREADGLAMSSRNIYLSAAERSSALCLSRAIKHARQLVGQGLREATTILSELRDLIAADQAVQIEYVNVVDRFNLSDQAVVDQDSVLLLAVRIGHTRLIDNGRLIEGEVG